MPAAKYSGLKPTVISVPTNEQSISSSELPMSCVITDSFSEVAVISKRTGVVSRAKIRQRRTASRNGSRATVSVFGYDG